MSGEHSTGAGAELLLPLDLATVRVARDFVRQHCHTHGVADDACDTAMLLTSETVTNAFIHGRSDARVRITVLPGSLLVEVADDNSRHPRQPESDPDALDGRGLSIVDLLAERWGVRDDPFGKTVWFEIRDQL